VGVLTNSPKYVTTLVVVMSNDIIKIPSPEELTDTYTKTFKMQCTGADGETIRVSVPREIVKREAKRHKISIRDFIKKFRVEWRYNSFPGFYGMFVPIDSNEVTTNDRTLF